MSIRKKHQWTSLDQHNSPPLVVEATSTINAIVNRVLIRGNSLPIQTPLQNCQVSRIENLNFSKGSSCYLFPEESPEVGCLLEIAPAADSPPLSPMPCSSPSPVKASPIGHSATSSPPSSRAKSSPSSSSLPPSPPTRHDDELTPLTWLQDSNLLKGTALSPIKAPSSGGDVFGGTVEKRRPRSSRKERPAASSPTKVSELLRRCKVESFADSEDDVSGTEVDTQRGDRQHHLPLIYNPKVHTSEKPPFSFSCLIFMAIEESFTKALPVKDIYSWILDHYPYYQRAPNGWKNSVRHNLSLNKCFCKVEKSANLGKGSLWMVEPSFRPNLLQAMSKTPNAPGCHWESSYSLSSKPAANAKCHLRFSDTTESDPLDRPDQRTFKLLVKSSSSSLHLNGDAPEEAGRSKYPTDEIEVVLKTDKKQKLNKNREGNFIPDPELFPRLSKRLEVQKVTHHPIEDEDVDAAAAMLVLKHGPSMLSSNNGISNCWNQSRHRRKEQMIDTTKSVSSSPSNCSDHSYFNQSDQDSRHQNGQISSFINLRTQVDNMAPLMDGNAKQENKNWEKILGSLEERNALLDLASIAASLSSSSPPPEDGLSANRVPKLETQSTLISETQNEQFLNNNNIQRSHLTLRKRKASSANDFLSRKLCRKGAAIRKGSTRVAKYLHSHSVNSVSLKRFCNINKKSNTIGYQTTSRSTIRNRNTKVNS